MPIDEKIEKELPLPVDNHSAISMASMSSPSQPPQGNEFITTKTAGSGLLLAVVRHCPGNALTCLPVYQFSVRQPVVIPTCQNGIGLGRKQVGDLQRFNMAVAERDVDSCSVPTLVNPVP